MSEARDLQGVIFDLDGTLVDSAPAIAEVLSSMRAERGLAPISAARVRDLVSLGVETLVGEGLSAAPDDPPEDIAEFRLRLAAVAIPAHPYPGVVDMLRELAGRGLALAVLTNKPERLSHRLLNALDLSAAFATVVGGDTTPYAKPHPAPLDRVLEDLGLAAGSVAYVGDSVVDLETAAVRDAAFLLFTRGYGAEGCEGREVWGRFDHHARLPALLDRWPPPFTCAAPRV